jgi:hypothetical protein
MSTFDLIARRIITEAALSEYGITPDFTLQAWIKSRYKEIIDSVSFGNINKQITTAFSTVAQYATGTVTVVNGSAAVIGVGTTWPITMIGESFRVTGSTPFAYYTISAVTDTTHLTLDTTYAGAGAAGASYVIVQRLYSLPIEVKWVVGVIPVGQSALVENSQEALRESAPDRTAVPGVPTIWSAVGWDITTGQRRLELYTAPDIVYRVLVSGYANIDFPTLSSAPIVEIDDRLITEGVLADALIYRASKQLSAEAVTISLKIAELHENRYMMLLNNLKRRDAQWV